MKLMSAASIFKVLIFWVKRFFKKWKLSKMVTCKKNTEKITSYSILFLIILGFIGVLASAYFVEKVSPSSGTLESAFSSALTTVSVALIGFGIFSGALDTRNWRDYFSERVKEVVIDNDYLNTLDQDTLKELQTRLLKSQFKNQAIDKEGSFLNYFHLHLHRFISEPYREDVSTEVLMQIHQTDTRLFKVTDKVRYVCRASAGKIQSHVAWKPDEGEFEKVLSLSVNVQFPSHHKDAGKKVQVFSKEGDELDADIKQGINISLKDYQDIDSLVVITKSEYLVEIGKFQYWQMAHPTKNFDVTITYPCTHRIQFKTLVLEDAVNQITEHAGYLKFVYGAWALPQSGLAWLIRNDEDLANTADSQ